MKYNMIGTMIIANTVDLRVYTEERREESCSQQKRACVKFLEPTKHGEYREKHPVLSGKA